MATKVPPADPLQSVFDHLEAEKTLIANLTLTWKNLADHFSSLEQTLADRSLALDSKIEELDAETAKTLESLDLREASIPDRESAATALIEERKNSSVSELEDAEAKLPEDLKGFLRFYCRSMDSSGLWRFVLSRRKDLAVRRHEITDAVGLAVDPARLVLDAVEDFLAQPTGEGTWALGMLISSLFDSDGKKAPEVSDGIREKAAGVTAAMKAKLEGKEEEGGGGAGFADAQMFLQMVVVFGLGWKFEEEFLRKLVIEHASRKEMAKLAAGLGFGEKLADIIDVLVKSNKQIEAVYFAHEAGLMEQFSPTLLLKTYLQTSRKNSNTIRKNGNHSIASIEAADNEEITTLKSIIRCVETLHLESKFSLEGIVKRLALLEKAKAERKKSASATKFHQKKRGRVGSAAPNYRPAKAVRNSNVAAASYHHRNPPVTTTTHQIPAASRHPYSYPVQIAVHGQTPQQFYLPEDMGGARNPLPFGGPGYGGYDYGAPNASASAQPSYPR